MPFYEYQCSQCNHITEVLQKMGEDNPPACAKCGSAETHKVMSAAGVQMGPSGPSADCPTCPTAPSCSMPSSGCPGGMCGI